MTIDILGLGESLSLYKKEGLAIGVNDIYRYHQPSIVVCIDHPQRFDNGRLSTIMSCKPDMFYSHLNEWQFKSGFCRITFASEISDLSLDEHCAVPKSNNSPFVAACIAYTLGATEIRLWGVDLNSHKSLSRPDMLKTSLRHFHQLYLELKKRHVLLSCAKGSKLVAVMPSH